MTSTRESDFSHQHSCWQRTRLSALLISTEIVSGVPWGGSSSLLKDSRLSGAASSTMCVIAFSLKCSQRAYLPLLLKERTENNLGTYR